MIHQCVVSHRLFVGDDVVPSPPKPTVRLLGAGLQVTHVAVMALRICLKNTRLTESDMKAQIRAHQQGGSGHF